MTQVSATMSSGAAPAWQPPRALLVVLAGNMLIDALEVSTMVVAAPAVRAGLHLSLAAVQWTLSGFAVGFGGPLLFGVRVVDLLGRRRVYLAALLVFAAASVLSALSGDISLLVAARFVKGFCAGLTAPTGLAIIATAYPEGRERSRALSVYTLFGASGFSVGLVLAGLLTTESWRWTLLFPALAVLALFPAAVRLVPDDAPPTGRPRHFGLPAAACQTGALLALIGAFAMVPAQGWAGAPVIGLFLAAAVALSSFLLLERRSPQSLVRAALLRDRRLLGSSVGAAAFNGSYMSLLLVITFQMQSGMGWSPLRTGAALLPASVPLAVTALASGKLVRRFGPPRLIVAGMTTALAGYLIYPHAIRHESYVSDILPTLLLIAAGFVLAFAALNTQAVSGRLPGERAAAGGTYQTAVQCGGAISVAVTAALCGRGPVLDTAALWFIIAVAAAGLLAASVTPRRQEWKGEHL